MPFAISVFQELCYLLLTQPYTACTSEFSYKPSAAQTYSTEHLTNAEVLCRGVRGELLFPVPSGRVLAAAASQFIEPCVSFEFLLKHKPRVSIASLVPDIG